MPDFKCREPSGGGPGRFLNVSNIGRHFRLDGIEEIADLAGGAFDHQLHPPVRQIPHETGHVEPSRQRPNRIAKPDALHAAGVVDFALLPWSVPTPLRSSPIS